MSFKSRENKRRAKLAVVKSRSDNKGKMAGRHYRTIVSRHASCNNCGGALREGRECVFRYAPKEILCICCADVRGLQPRLSERWEKWRAKQEKIEERAAA
jgi:hypothetical protein